MCEGKRSLFPVWAVTYDGNVPAVWPTKLLRDHMPSPTPDPSPRRRASQTGSRPPAPRLRDGETHDESWELVASWYDSLATDQGTDYHQKVVIPGVLRLLQTQPDEKVLDLACGQGAVARALHAGGAHVTGVDLSPELIKHARQRSPRGIGYLVGDARSLPDLPDCGFDAAICVLAIQNIDPMGPVFAEAARVLRPGGRLVVVLMHPAFRIPRQSGWRWNEDNKLMVREVNRYLSPLKIPIDVRPFRSPGKQLIWTYHRPLQEYVNGLAAAGFWMAAMEEWPSHRESRLGPRARGENRARAEIPLFLALRAVRADVALPRVARERAVPAVGDSRRKKGEDR